MHDLHLAEAKGTGIRAMRRLAGEAGLHLPEFHSDRQANEFKVTLFLHNLLTEEDYAWLHGLAGNTLGPEEAKVLIYARETGAVDNTTCRDFSGLDTLAASNVLRRLRDRGLLEKQGSGSRTYYTLSIPTERPMANPEQAVLPLGEVDIPVRTGVSPYGDSQNPHMPIVQFPEVHVGIGFLDFPHGALESIADVGGHGTDVIPVAVIRDLEAVRLREQGQLGIAGFINDLGVFLIPDIANPLKKEQREYVGLKSAASTGPRRMLADSQRWDSS